MAQININDVYTGETTQSTSQVGFFSLQNDGDEAVVRFMVDSLEDLEILTVHDIRVGGKFRQVSCVRDPREPLEKCPLCARGEKVKQIVFIKMIQYVHTPTGIEAKPVVWQRSASTYAFRMKGYLDNYGPMSNILCKVIRHGARGDMQTTYDIIPNLNPTQFPQEQFPIITDAFNGYKALGRVVLDKTPEDILTFINTGDFPSTENNSASQVTPQPVPTMTEPSLGQAPWEVNTQQFNNNDSVVSPQTMERPTRYY